MACGQPPDVPLALSDSPLLLIPRAQIYVWAIRTGQLLDVLAAHEGPAVSLSFNPARQLLASASWDKTVRLWDVFAGNKVAVETLQHRCRRPPSPAPSRRPLCPTALSARVDRVRLYCSYLCHDSKVTRKPRRPLPASPVPPKPAAVPTPARSHDVLAVAHHPTGKQLCCSTLDGQLHFWDPEAGTLQGTIDMRLDIAGGRLPTDRRAAGNASSGRCFTSLSYSADGAFVVGGGRTKYVCVYDTKERVMLARFQVSSNRSLAGVLDQLNSRNMSDAGPVDLIDDADGALPPELFMPLRPAASLRTPWALHAFASYCLSPYSLGSPCLCVLLPPSFVPAPALSRKGRRVPLVLCQRALQPSLLEPLSSFFNL